MRPQSTRPNRHSNRFPASSSRPPGSAPNNAAAKTDASSDSARMTPPMLSSTSKLPLPRIFAPIGPRTTSPIHDARPSMPPTTPHGRPNPSPSCTVAVRSGMRSARAPEPWSASLPNRTAQRSLFPPSPPRSTGSQVTNPLRWFAFTTKASRAHVDARFEAGDTLLFGPETRGLPDDVLEAQPQEFRLRIPMRAHARSLNLSNAVAIAAYEAWRQCGFSGT